MSRSIPQVNSDKPLGGRYKVINQLGVGGFGRTFLAEDLHLPGHPRCVVKQLKPQFRSDDTLQMARRCFNTEAQVLYRLGNHQQIPQLLAHFEDNQEFYLAQEFIEGDPLAKELVDGKRWSEHRVVALLKDILRVLVFVHEQQVIHRDLKPSNLIRRRRDGRIVLIDFGAVKQVSSQTLDPDTGLTNLTISIGTQGYMPNEQLAGKPRFSSDIYAVGILGVQALTGVHPKNLGDDDKGEIAWRHRATHASLDLMDVLDRMVRYDFRERYQTAAEALVVMENLPEVDDDPAFAPEPYTESESDESESSSSFLKAIEVKAPELDSAVGGERIVIGSEFSSIDQTVAGEEGISTAIWVQPDVTDPLNLSSEPPVSVTHGTGLTQAIGRPHPSDPSHRSTNQRRLANRWIQPLSALAIAVAAGLTFVIVQTVLPRFMAQVPESEPSVTPTSSPESTLLPSSPIPLSPDQQAKQLSDQAHQLMGAKNYSEALNLFNQAITLKPDFAEAYAGRCECLNQLNRPEEAIVSCNDALAYRPDYPEAEWSKGNALLLQGRTLEALGVYEDVTYLKPDFAPGWVKRGVALQMLGRSAEALYSLDQAISLQRNLSEAWKARGEALMTLQRYEEAVVSLDKALQLAPDDPETQALRQGLRDQLGR
ncbi:MAG: tetratricopeptide repeat protein [Cyanobacteria bacterium CRU_2_1]|nr:tetratricopeptide repeat protein [Cyanobacteria bacterium RU_5_0]NJR60449.1 tetratricopeptide repeat protein [Cyanobacteria bacterium CRU_2_1]